MFSRRDAPFKVARVPLDPSPWHVVSVYAFTAEDAGAPTVGVGNSIEYLGHMRPGAAEKLAAALLLAAKVARGEIGRPANDTIPAGGLPVKPKEA